MMTVNDKVDQLGRKFAVLQKKMDEQKQNSCKEAAQVILSAKSEIKDIYGNLQKKSAQGQELFYHKLFHAQKSFNRRKEQIIEEADRFKSHSQKKREKAEVEQAAEYAEFAVDAAMIAIEEATLAFYDAVEKAEAYLKRYGDDG